MNEFCNNAYKHLYYQIEYACGYNCYINGGKYDEKETDAWKQGYKDASGITQWNISAKK